LEFLAKADQEAVGECDLEEQQARNQLQGRDQDEKKNMNEDGGSREIDEIISVEKQREIGNIGFGLGETWICGNLLQGRQVVLPSFSLNKTSFSCSWKWKWKRMWFVLVGNTLLYYTDKNRRYPQGFTSIAGANVSRLNTQKFLPCVFEMTTKKFSLYLQAESEEKTREWIENLRRGTQTELSGWKSGGMIWMKRAKRIATTTVTTTTRTTITKTTTTTSHPSLPEPWRLFFFTIQKKSLYYYSEKGSSGLFKLKGKIPLDDVVISREKYKEKGNEKESGATTLRGVDRVMGRTPSGFFFRLDNKR